jgi:hypothetical protein
VTMLAAAQLDRIGDMFDNHPSLSASLEDFEEHQRQSPLFGLPSQHSGFKSESSDADAESSTGEPWSPPGFRKPHTSLHSGRGGWYNHEPYGQRRFERPSTSPSRSRETSPQYEDAMEGELDGDITIPANIPLPAGTDSPWKEQSPEPTDNKQAFGRTDEQGVGEPIFSNCTCPCSLLNPPSLC